MGDDQVMKMSKVIGQIEDELRDIKSAKEQAEAVIGSNKVLSDSLQSLFDSSSNMAKAVESNTQQIIADITNKIEILNTQAADVQSYAQQGVSEIREQSALAQSKLEDELGNLVKKLVDTISISTNQSLDTIKNDLVENRVLVHDAAEVFRESTSDAIAKQEKQITEIGTLIASIQEKENVLELKIEELRQMDVVRLFDEINKIRGAESEKVADIKKWRLVEIGAFAICIMLGVAVLINSI